MPHRLPPLCFLMPLCLVAWAFAWVGPANAGEANPDAIERGALLYKTASCVGCHSWGDGGFDHLAGGRPTLTDFGTFATPNISPDVETGLGAWTYDDFVRAMRRGISPDGRRYWPTFPYRAYTQMSDSDLADLWAYLRSQPAVVAPQGGHEPRFPYGAPGLLRVWQALNVVQGPLEPDPLRSEAWNRGRYISEAYGYCGACHSPYNRLGGIKTRLYMAGGINRAKEVTEVAPNLTSHPEVGIGSWSEDDIVRFLSTGEKPDGSVAQLTMHEKIVDSFRYLSSEDLRSLAVYLRSLPPIDYSAPTR